MSSGSGSPLAEPAASLNDLVQRLHPDPSPDVLTLDSYRYRYPLSGRSAERAIAQSQRINRRAGNYVQAGLCEFHIGLIYLHTHAPHGARQQFELARQQWAFVTAPASMALAYLAEGVANQLLHRVEAAMRCFTQVEQWLPRITFAANRTDQDAFVTAVRAYLSQYRSEVRDHLWPEETTAAPVVNLDSVILGHRRVNQQYQWFTVSEQPSVDFFPPDVTLGTFLLVDRKPALQQGELVLVTTPAQTAAGRIQVKPAPGEGVDDPAVPYFLAWLESDPETAVGDSVQVAFSPRDHFHSVSRTAVVGAIVGFWFPVQIQ